MLEPRLSTPSACLGNMNVVQEADKGGDVPHRGGHAIDWRQVVRMKISLGPCPPGTLRHKPARMLQCWISIAPPNTTKPAAGAAHKAAQDRTGKRMANNARPIHIDWTTRAKGVLWTRRECFKPGKKLHTLKQSGCNQRSISICPET